MRRAGACPLRGREARRTEEEETSNGPALGRGAIFGTGDETADDDADKIDIPIHAFDVIVADECHRGYTSQEVSTWRSTLDHFDAIKIGLTATPASHTTAYFAHKVFDYPYEQAVRDGHLVDYDA